MANTGDTVISQAGKEFFNLIVPGFYIISNITVTFFLFLEHEPTTYLQMVSTEMASQWPIAVVAVFLSYLMGQVVSAVPVHAPDIISKKLYPLYRPLLGIQTQRWAKTLYEDIFPYPRTILESIHFAPPRYASLISDVVIGRKEGEEIPDPNGDALGGELEQGFHYRFNLVKMHICSLSPLAFSVTQYHRNRVLMHAGFLWAGLGGMLLGLLSIVAALCLGKPPLVYAFQVLFGLTLTLTFGLSLRRVRFDEVSYILFAYAATVINKP